MVGSDAAFHRLPAGEIWTGDDPLRMDYLQIEGEIAGAMAVRATPDNKLTMSYDTFGSGDTIGFFSYHDPNCAKPDRWSHRKGNDDTLYLKNTKLTYSDMEGKKIHFDGSCQCGFGQVRGHVCLFSVCAQGEDAAELREIEWKFFGCTFR